MRFHLHIEDLCDREGLLRALGTPPRASVIHRDGIFLLRDGLPSFVFGHAGGEGAEGFEMAISE